MSFIKTNRTTEKGGRAWQPCEGRYHGAIFRPLACRDDLRGSALRTVAKRGLALSVVRLVLIKDTVNLLSVIPLSQTSRPDGFNIARLTVR